MNFLFLSRNKSHPAFLFHDHLCLDPQHQTKVVLQLSIANANGEVSMDFKGLRIWAFANDQDMGTEGTMLHSNYLHLFVFIYICYTGRSYSKQLIGSSWFSPHCKPSCDSCLHRSIQQKAPVYQKNLIPYLLASLC